MPILFNAGIKDLVLQPVVARWQRHVAPSVSQFGLQFEEITPENEQFFFKLRSQLAVLFETKSISVEGPRRTLDKRHTLEHPCQANVARRHC